MQAGLHGEVCQIYANFQDNYTSPRALLWQEITIEPEKFLFWSEGDVKSDRGWNSMGSPSQPPMNSPFTNTCGTVWEPVRPASSSWISSPSSALQTLSLIQAIWHQRSKEQAKRLVGHQGLYIQATCLEAAQQSLNIKNNVPETKHKCEAYESRRDWPLENPLGVCWTAL